MPRRYRGKIILQIQPLWDATGSVVLRVRFCKLYVLILKTRIFEKYVDMCVVCLCLVSEIEYAQMRVEIAGLKEIVVKALHSADHNREGHKLLVHHMKNYKQKMQADADMKSTLYKHYATRSKEWMQEKSRLESYVRNQIVDQLLPLQFVLVLERSMAN